MNNELIGLWKLQTWTLTDANNKVIHPFGSDALGVLIYTEGGYMSVHVMKKKYQLNQSGSALEATPQEAQQILQSYFSYCGKYSIDHKRQIVQHDIELMTTPNRIGTTVERHYQLKDSMLILSHKQPHKGEEKDSQLIWHRGD